MPTVNTLVVDRADRLGLGQLHQLRGRVGRSGQRAYAYLFHPRDRALSETAYERLKTIGETTELGSGFKIAMRDLEIRGAGNLLGESQSGHIAAVGYDLYVEMVSEAVAELKGEPVREPAEIKIDLPVAANLPAGLRAPGGPAHRGLPPAGRGHHPGARSTTSGPSGSTATARSPQPAEALLDVARVRAECARLGITEVTVAKGPGFGGPAYIARLTPDRAQGERGGPAQAPGQGGRLQARAAASSSCPSCAADGLADGHRHAAARAGAARGCRRRLRPSLASPARDALPPHPSCSPCWWPSCSAPARAGGGERSGPAGGHRQRHRDLRSRRSSTSSRPSRATPPTSRPRGGGRARAARDPRARATATLRHRVRRRHPRRPHPVRRSSATRSSAGASRSTTSAGHRPRQRGPDRPAHLAGAGIDGEAVLDGFREDYRDYLVEREAEVLALQADLAGSPCVERRPTSRRGVLRGATATEFAARRRAPATSSSTPRRRPTRSSPLLAGGRRLRRPRRRALAATPAARRSGGELGCVAGRPATSRRSTTRCSPSRSARSASRSQTEFGFHVIRVDRARAPRPSRSVRDRGRGRARPGGRGGLRRVVHRGARRPPRSTVDPRYGDVGPPTRPTVVRPAPAPAPSPPTPATRRAADRVSGRLAVVGLGPGRARAGHRRHHGGHRRGRRRSAGGCGRRATRRPPAAGTDAELRRRLRGGADLRRRLPAHRRRAARRRRPTAADRCSTPCPARRGCSSAPSTCSSPTAPPAGVEVEVRAGAVVPRPGLGAPRRRPARGGRAARRRPPLRRWPRPASGDRCSSPTATTSGCCPT